MSQLKVRLDSHCTWFKHSFEFNSLSAPTSYDGALLNVITELVGGRVCMVVVGAAGAGKTFLAKCVVEQLKLKGTFKFVIYLDIEKVSNEALDSDLRLGKFLVREGLIILEEESRFLEIKGKEPQSIALIVDHLDHLDQVPPENAYLRHLVSMSQSANTEVCGRLFLMRQASPDLISSVTHHITLGGFDSVGTALKFMQQQLTQVHKISRMQPLQQYIQMHPVVSGLCIIPRMAEILVKVYAKDTKCIKDTETLLVHKMVIEWLKQAMPRLAVDSLYKLPAEPKGHLLHFAQIAYHSLSLNATSEGVFSLAASEISYVNLQEGFSSLDAVRNFGLVQCSGNTVHRFLHVIIQEFLAAFYVSCLPQDEQIAFYYEHFPKNVSRFQRVCLFHFGLTRLETEEFLNPSKIILAGMIESLAHVTEKQEGGLYLELQKLIQACLYEAQDRTLVKNFCQQSPKFMQLTFNDERALDDTRLTGHLVYVILNSEIDDWEIAIPAEKFRGRTDTLVFPISSAVTDRIIKVGIKIQPGQSAIYKLKAVFQAKPPRRTGRATEMLKRAKNDEEKEMYFQLAMQCTGQRETLHRVTQLYSPVPVKSDATDPAYASLITCGCVEPRLREEIVFEPIHPIHTVPLSSKSRKTKGGNGERDASTRKHIEETHKNNYLEIIVLNQPSVKSITFQPPGGVQQCRLVLSTEKLPSCMSGRIAMEVEKSVIDQSCFVECMQEKSGGKTTRMIAHGLPLPKNKTKIEADKANVLQAEEGAGVRFHDDLDVPATAAQVAPSHRHFQEGDISLYSPIPVQAESTEKVTWRPGMIMFTTLPDVFQKHKSYALPAEDHQIRRGGNGQIFSTDYLGYSLVAKKTLFRNREYNIIIRLKHANVVPLLALMVGDVSHRRRFFCYHMLPKMSGDCARMLSDHSNLTLAALKQTHAEEPRQFGLALGNMRYLLAEVLKGLAYMHDLHIVHRDVKASNILVRFHCQHENLLWCTCPHKYSVCVCDFDAAVELGPEDELLPISPSNQVYYLPPVGTQGFRSPEGSQLVVASHSDAIVPRLTPRSDIWSFGVLMLRLFLGEDGPSTQRQNSILLLKYHQMKGMKEGRTRDRKLLVMDREVEKLLKFPILRSKLTAVSNLVNFVSRCLQLDPEQRPTSKELLQDPFLY